MAEAPRMAGEGIEKLDRDITCLLCSKHYSNPRLLDCCHYYCKSCLEKKVKSTKGTASVFECPKCKESTNISDTEQLPPVLFVKHLKSLHDRMSKLEEKREGGGGGGVSCEMCSELQAVAFCRECGEFICSECVAAHQKMKVKFAGHQVLSFAELKQNKGNLLLPTKPTPITKCKAHSELCKLYCFDCQKLICRDCIIIDHAEHQYEFVNKSAAICRETLKQQLPPLSQLHTDVSQATREVTATKCAVSSQGVYVADHIRKSFAKMYDSLKQREEQLIKQAKEMVQRKLLSLNAQENKLNRSANGVRNLIEYIEQNLQVLNEEELLSVQRHLVVKLKQESEKNEGMKLDPVETANMAVKIVCVEEIARLCKDKAQVYLFPEIEGSHVASLGKETTQYVIDPTDTNHESTSPVTASLKSLVDNTTINVPVFKAGKGLYEVRYTPLVRGRHELTISLDGEPIPNSPFPVFVSIPPSQLGPDPVRIIRGLRHPYSVVCDPQKQLLVSESSGMKIKKLQKDGSLSLNGRVGHFDHLEAESPTGLAIDGDGNIYVASASGHTITKYGKEGKLLRESGGQGRGEGEMEHPCGLAIINERLFVCDRNNSRVQLFDLELNPLQKFGSHGTQQGQFQWPYDLAQDKNGEIFISDCDNHRIQVFTENGEFVHTFGTRGNERGHLKRPMGVCIGAENHLFVTEFDNHRVSVFKSDGTFVTSFCKYGSKAGQLCYPMGVAVDNDGFVYICDQGNNRIQVF